MLTDEVPNEVTESTSLPADVTDDSCKLELIEIVPLTRDTDGRCTTECDSGDWSGEVKQENLPVVKQEPEEVWLRCFIHRLISPMHQTYIRLLLSSIDAAVALLNSSVNPSIQSELKTDAPSCCQ